MSKAIEPPTGTSLPPGAGSVPKTGTVARAWAAAHENGALIRTRSARAWAAAHEPVDAASATFFRIAFGLAMVINTISYMPRLVDEYYVDTGFHFPYGHLTFVAPPPGRSIQLVYVAMVVCGALIALGKWYRWAAGAFCVLTTYVFLLDSTYFQNHEYLISLLSLLLVVLPLDGMWSLDARAGRSRPSQTVPRWVVWLLRFQIGVPYFYGGIAKLSSDWLQGEPLRTWVGSRTDMEPMSTLLGNGTVVWVMTYGALALDLAVVWLLLNRRTRLPAYVVVTCFHVTNAWLFGLHIFPWLMIAATTIFFPPDWPRRWTDERKAAPKAAGLPPVGIASPIMGASAGGAPAPAVGAPASGSPAPAVGASAGSSPAPVPATPVDLSQLDVGAPAAAGSGAARPSVGRARAVALGCGIWCAVQILVPLRHYALPGDTNWTEEGHRFSWHMKLRDKQGTVTFVVTKGGETWRVDPRDLLNGSQTARLAGHPERLVHFARFLSDREGGAEVRAETMVSLNGRPPQPIVDPTVDLASVALPGRGAPWILPLEEPLPRG